MPDSDGALVRRVLDGETECFRLLVERYQDAVFGVALSRTGNIADAEDIAQDSFLTTYESLPQLDEPHRFGAWLYGIARNKANARARSENRRRRREESAGRALE